MKKMLYMASIGCLVMSLAVQSTKCITFFPKPKEEKKPFFSRLDREEQEKLYKEKVLVPAIENITKDLRERTEFYTRRADGWAETYLSPNSSIGDRDYATRQVNADRAQQKLGEADLFALKQALQKDDDDELCLLDLPVSGKYLSEFLQTDLRQALEENKKAFKKTYGASSRLVKEVEKEVEKNSPNLMELKSNKK